MTRRRVAIIGSGGQLGTDLVACADPGLWAVTPLPHSALDVCDWARVSAVLEDLRPDLVIDLAAFHKVDLCEDQPAPTFAVNTLAAHHLACETARLGAAFAYVSTDYVFAGDQPTPRVETDRGGPQSLYGLSKYAGERLSLGANPRAFVFRVSGLYGLAGASGKGGGNFVETMLRLGRTGAPVRVVDDQILTPTFTADLAPMMWRILEIDRPGIYHCTSTGACSWFDFAAEIFRRAGLSVDLAPQSSAQAGLRAPRPAYSVLDNAALRALGLDDLRPWPEALADYLHRKHGI